MLIRYRDGKTPEEQTKQILKIYAILPGQRLDRQFSIPSRKSSMNHLPSNQGQDSHPHSDPQQGEPQGQIMGDLIDLSDPVTRPQEDPKPNPSVGDAGDKHAKHQDSWGRREDNPPPKLLVDQSQMPQSEGLKRLDTQTQEEEEFHDARS